MAGFTIGETVRVKDGAPLAARPGAIGTVTGFRPVKTPPEARQLAALIGTMLYLVEFGDGQTVEVPEAWLEAARE